MKNAIRLFATLALAALVTGTLFAATAPAKKPAAKKPASTNKATMGTTQMKSDYNNPKFGETFTLGKKAPINVTINSAEYTTEQVFIDKVMMVPKSDEKFLVLHYTLHNPNKADYGLSWHTLEIFGVDANDKNWRFVGDVGIEGTGDKCNMALKPGQKTKVYTIIKMPAQGALPKLVLQSPDKLVLRYQLLQKDAKGNYINPVKPLPAPIADPSDPTGGTALENVPAQIGTYCSLWDFDAKVDSIAFSDAPIKGKAPKSGERYLVATMTAKNRQFREIRFVWSTIKPRLLDQDNGEIKVAGDPLFASRDDAANTPVAPGQEIRVRFYFSVPQNLPLRSFSIMSGGSRWYVYDVSDLK